MIEKYEWLNKKTPRAVDQIRLWPENPRLNPEENHLTLSDFAEDLTFEKADRDDFYNLVNSIVEDGFVPADPVVVWKNTDNNKYYVAEGNRRLVALKLLREPNKAPKSIRSFIRRASNKINLSDIEKIPVNVAPTFDDAEWYINQRNSSSSLQRRWSSEQQRRWVSTLYDKYNGDIDKIISVTKLSKSELENIIRLLKIKDFVKLFEVKSKLSEDEFSKANSYRFPITILERFFNFSLVKEKWGLEYEGIDVKIISNKRSFFNAFAELIKRIVNNNDDKINTRLTKDDLDEVLASLPTVLFDEDDLEEVENNNSSSETENNQSSTNDTNQNSGSADNGQQDGNGQDNSGQSATIQHLKGNPSRNKMVLPIYELHTSSYRLLGIFNELKKISLGYKNIVSASLRVFLDLAVLNYIETEGIENDLKSYYREDLKNIPLKKRLEYIKANKLNGKTQIIVTKLIDPSQQYSLDVLNGYVHGQDSHYLNKEFLNGFWDFLFPLFQVLLDIREK
ncbi:MAG: ParB/RepB/Spo0J family partition protein [Flavobacterium sp.]|nr:ParB/RepB/Spo0J family partition protein [Flavobacterium sp.]